MTIRVGLVVALLGACGGGGGGLPGLDGGPPEDPYKPVTEFPVTVNRNIDMLFVVDDSGSMQDKQANLANNFPNFINVLNAQEGGLPDIHLGVVTTDMGTSASSGAPGPGIGTVGQGGCANTGDDGVLQTNGAAVTGKFISDIRQTDGTRLKNYTGDLATVFAQMAKVGATGCGFEQPLAAMRRALANTTANPGFLRPDALLAVVFLTDEDDCSAKTASLFAAGDTGALGPLNSFRCTRFGVTCAQGGTTTDEMNQIGTKSGCTASTTSTVVESISVFRDFLLGLKSDPRKVVVGGIMGNTTPFAVEQRQINSMSTIALARSCTYQGATGVEVADPGVRMKAFFDAFPDRSTSTTICQPDLSAGLTQIATLLNRAVGSPCVNSAILADVDASTPGLQPDCLVDDKAGSMTTPIAACRSPETAPCWKLVSDPVKCPALDNLRLEIVRSEAPRPDTVTTMRCILE